MASINKVIIIGGVGKDPELRYMPDGGAVCNLSVATSEQWKDKTTGEKHEATEWHRLTFYKKLAEIVGEYVKKGSSIYVEGALKTRKWKDKEGVERYTTEIVCSEMKMLGARPEGTGEKVNHSKPDPARQDKAPSGNFNDFEDDIPF